MFRSDDIKWFDSGVHHNKCDYTRDITTNTTLTKMEEYSKHFCERILTHWKVFKVESIKISMFTLQDYLNKNISIKLKNYTFVCSYGRQVEMYGYLLIKSLMICESAWTIINNDNYYINDDDNNNDNNSDDYYINDDDDNNDNNSDDDDIDDNNSDNDN
jgi:hypothetical protein